MNRIQDDILSYREMCDAENVQTLQRGMNFKLNPKYSVILMSQRSNAPYKDKIYSDGITIEYEGHDEAKNSPYMNAKEIDQPEFNKSGSPTQNGLFINAIKKGKNIDDLELVKVYEKILSGVWSLKGFFNLIDYKIVNDGKRNVYRFILRLSERSSQNISNREEIDLDHTRLIPSEIKKEVWKRDSGKCVICGSQKNLHFDHDLPFSKGGTSLTAKNIRLLCAKHNLSKSDKIE
jgi:hypothetical protein